MAPTKNRTQPAKIPPATPAATPAAVAETDDDPDAVDRMLAAAPALSDIHRSAFEGQYSDADCDEAGAGTKAQATFREASRAVMGIEAVVAAHAAAIRYGAPRLRFLLETIRSVGAAVRAQEKGGTARDELDLASAEAVNARAELVRVFEPLCGKKPAEQRAFTDARGTIDTVPNILTSLVNLADLGKKWLARKDAGSRALVETHYLTQADVDAALRAKQRLDRAQEALTRGASPSRDTPATNRDEGRMILEVDVLRLALERAHEKDHLIPQLVLGPVLRRVLVRTRTKAAPADPPAPPAPGDPPKP